MQLKSYITTKLNCNFEILDKLEPTTARTPRFLQITQHRGARLHSVWLVVLQQGRAWRPPTKGR